MLMNHESTWSYEEHIASDPKVGNKTVLMIVENMQRIGWLESDLFGVHMALEEAIINAIKHGNLEDPDKRVHVVVNSTSEEFYLKVTDEGEGFDPDDVPDGLLNRLRDGLDPAGLGEVRIDIRRELTNATQRQIAAMFGPDSARLILTINDDLWHGPIESSVGVHFVRKIAYKPARKMPYEQVEQYLAGDWTMAQTRKRIEQEIESLRDEYDIVVEGVKQ